MKCVVTGGSGFIGSHVVDHLRAAGHQVTNIDVRDCSGADCFVQADIRDTDTLTDVFAENGKDAVFHIAAIANARQALDDPVGAMDINVKGTASVLEAARRASVGRVILASTVWYYNAVDRTIPPETEGIRYLDENEPIAPRGGGHTYTTSKIACEWLCNDFHQLYGLDFTILRYGIPYGPRMWSGLALRAFLDNSFAGKPIRIFGDGSAVRRFVYVGDLAHAHVLALSDAARNQAYNLEGERDITIRELAETVGRFVEGVTIEYIPEPTRRGELSMDGIVISNQKAKRELGWDLTTELEEGVRRTVQWYQEEILSESLKSSRKGVL